MRLSDIGFGYKSPSPSIDETIWGNYLTPESGGSLSDYNTPVPPVANPYKPPEIQRQTDASGNYWDEAAQAWRDPKSGLLWNGSGWGEKPAPQPMYFDTQEEADRFNTDVSLYGEQGGFQFGPQAYNEPVYGLPSDERERNRAAIEEAQSLASRMERNTVDYGRLAAEDQMYDATMRDSGQGLSEAFQVLQRGGYTGDQARSLTDQDALSRANVMTKTQQGFADRAGGSSLSAILSGAGKVANTYAVNAVRPFAESVMQVGGDLIKPILSGMNPAAMPGRPGYQRETTDTTAGIREFGTAVKESGGNPLKFRDLQNENFAERPMWQQMAGETILDPGNIVGVGGVTKALQGVKGAGVLSDILRGAGTANKAFDVAQAKAGLPIIGGVAGFGGSALSGGDTKQNVLAGLTGVAAGAAAPTIARKAIAPVLEKAFGSDAAKRLNALALETGYTSPAEMIEAAAKGDVSLQARIIEAGRTLVGDESGGVAADFAAIPVKAAGKAVQKGAIPALGGVAGYATAPDDATPAERALYILGGAAIGAGAQYAPKLARRLVRSETPAGVLPGTEGTMAPLGAGRKELTPLDKLENALMKFVGANGLVKDPRTQPMLTEFADSMAKVPSSSHEFGATTLARLKTAFPLDAEDRVANLPYLDETGKVIGEGPDIQQIAGVLPHYKAKNLLTPEQLEALEYVRKRVDEIYNSRDVVGLPKPTGKGIIDGGFYLPRFTDTEQAVTTFRPRRVGSLPASSKPRGFATRKAGEESPQHLKYMSVGQALEKYAREQLREIFEHRLASQLSEFGVMPDNILNADELAALKVIRGHIATARKDVKALQPQLRNETRAGNLAAGDIAKIEKRIEVLVQRAGKKVGAEPVADGSTAVDPQEALSLTRTLLTDARNKALAGARQSGVRDTKLETLLRQADQAEKRLEAAVKASPYGEVRQPGVRLPQVSDTAAAAELTKEGRRIAAELRKLGTATDAATDVAKGAADTAATQAKQLAATERQAIDLGTIDGEVDALERQIKVAEQRLANSGGKATDLMEKVATLRGQIDTAKVWRDAMKEHIGHRKAEAAIAREGKTEINNMSSLAGWKFDQEISASVQRAIDRTVGKSKASTEIYDAVNDSLRLLQATGDFSAFGIQLLKLSYSHPDIVAVAFREAMLSAADPQNLGRFIIKSDAAAEAAGEPLVREFAKYGLHINAGELGTSAHGRTGVTRKIEKSKLGQTTIAPFNRLYDEMGNISRIELAKVLWREAGAAGVNASAPETMRAIAKAANTATGWSPRTFGGDIGSRVLFAGRFFQSILDTMGKAIQPKMGLENAVAREQLTRMAGIGALITYAWNESQGYETEFNPLGDTGNWMRMRNVMGHDVSPFGPWDSVIRGMIYAGQDGSPIDFFRGRSAPVISLAADLVTGENFLGERTRDNPVQVAKTVGERLAPFGVVSAIDEGVSAFKGEQSALDAGFGSAAGFFGLKATPLTAWEKYQQEYEDAHDGKTWEETSGEDQQAWEKEHPRPEFTAGDTTRNDARKATLEQRLANETGAVEQYLGKDVPDYKGFRTRVSEIQRDTANQNLGVDEVTGGFDQGRPSDPNGQALFDYYATFDAVDLSGDLDFDAQEAALTALEATWTPEQKAWVDARRKAEHVPEVEALNREKAVVGDAGYWELRDQSWDKLREVYPEQFKDHPTFDDWYAGVFKIGVDFFMEQGRPEAVAIDLARKEVAKLETYKAMSEARNIIQHNWVAANPEAALLAIKWGYMTPDKEENQFLSEYASKKTP